MAYVVTSSAIDKTAAAQVACPICLSEEYDPVKYPNCILGCGHNFHEHCLHRYCTDTPSSRLTAAELLDVAKFEIDRPARQRARCPVCRSVFSQINGEQVPVLKKQVGARNEQIREDARLARELDQQMNGIMELQFNRTSHAVLSGLLVSILAPRP